MSSRIICPHCNGEIFDEPLEEPLNPTLTVVRKSKERGSWHDIAEGIANGRARVMFDKRDSIECELKDGRKVIIDVADIDLYGNKEVIFCFRDAVDERRMNESRTNRGGFVNAELNKWLNEDFFELLPDDLKEVISPRHIKQTINGTTFECDSRIWIPSIVEVGGDDYREYGTDEEEKQFDLFKDKRNRIKMYDNEVCYWWERSPYAGGSTFFMYVYSNGSPNGSLGAHYAYAVVPCFFIRANDEDDDE